MEKLYNVWGEKDPIERKREVRNGILAAIYLTNQSLIALQNRLNDKTIVRPLLQSEAQLIFKGNAVRILKQSYQSSDLNRMKRTISFIVILDQVHPLIQEIRVSWLNNHINYLPEYLRNLQIEVSQCIDSIRDSEIAMQATNAYKSILEKEVKPIVINEGKVTKKELTLSDINFDSLKNFKF